MFTSLFALILMSRSTLILTASASTHSEAQAWVHSLVETAQGKGKLEKGVKPFAAKGCPKIPAKKWASLVLLQEPIEHEYKFAPDCDVQGKITITIAPFPIDLQVRNLKEITHAKGLVKIGLNPRLMDGEVDLNGLISSGQGFDEKQKEVVNFDANYSVSLGIDGLLTENRGGKLNTQKFREAELKVTEPLLFKVK